MGIEWTDEYRVGIDKFDEHHKNLFTIASHLLDSYQAGELTKLRKIAVDLREYTVYHFDAEEDVMRENDYPLKTKHIREHDKFKQFVLDIYNDLDTLTPDTFAIKASYMARWIIEHIGKSDKEMCKYFIDAGIEVK